MPNIVNTLSLKQLTSAWSEAEGLLFFSMAGLTMEENEALRGAIFESGAQVRLVRNRLAMLALKENGMDVDNDVFKGNVAVAWGDAEATIGAAKVVTGSKLKKAGKLDVRGGMLEGNLLGASDAAALSDVPDRPTLQAKILGCIAGPSQSLVGLLNANQGALARVIQARVDAGGEE